MHRRRSERFTGLVGDGVTPAIDLLGGSAEGESAETEFAE